MARIFEPIQKKIQEIRRADDKAKKRWVFILSGLSMLLVFILWILYLNVSLPVLKSEIGAPPVPEKTSFLWTLGRGLTIVNANFRGQVKSATTKTMDTFKFFANQLNKANEFEIKAN